MSYEVGLPTYPFHFIELYRLRNIENYQPQKITGCHACAILTLGILGTIFAGWGLYTSVTGSTTDHTGEDNKDLELIPAVIGFGVIGVFVCCTGLGAAKILDLYLHSRNSTPSSSQINTADVKNQKEEDV